MNDPITYTVRNRTIIEKDLAPGIIAEANKDGTTFVSKDASPTKIKEAVKHEEMHHKHMESGRLSYTDNELCFDKKCHKRKDGKIFYQGKWQQEGWPGFGWEQEANT